MGYLGSCLDASRETTCGRPSWYLWWSSHYRLLKPWKDQMTGALRLSWLGRRLGTICTRRRRRQWRGSRRSPWRHFISPISFWVLFWRCNEHIDTAIWSRGCVRRPRLVILWCSTSWGSVLLIALKLRSSRKLSHRTQAYPLLNLAWSYLKTMIFRT